MCFSENSVKPRLEKRLIYDNSASRENKGTDFAMSRLHKFLNDTFLKLGHNNFYYLKCDISKFFESIDHDILLNLLHKAGFSNDELWFCEKIMRNGNYGLIGKGLPLGNQTSQWFSLLYMDVVDRIIKEKLRIKHYSRYMDDFVLIHESKQVLRNAKAIIEQACSDKLKLTLNKRKTVIGKVSNGVDYLGFVHKVLPNGKVEVKQRQQAKQRMKRKIKFIDKLYTTEQVDNEFLDIRESAYCNHLKNTKSKRWIRREFKKIRKRT